MSELQALAVTQVCLALAWWHTWRVARALDSVLARLANVEDAVRGRHVPCTRRHGDDDHQPPAVAPYPEGPFR